MNLALQAYHDAITGQIDHAVIVTNDTDIAPALEMIRVHTNVLIGVVVPTTDHTRPLNTDLVKLAHWKREYVNASELAACQLPRVIQSRKPTIKPESWYGQPELLREILDLAIPVRGSKAAAFKWMEQPNSYLDGKRPIELAESVEGANRVLEYIRNYIAQHAQAPDELNGS